MLWRSDTVSHVHVTHAESEHADCRTVPSSSMDIENSARVDSSAPASLTALAEQLRDGPLQRLVELQVQTTALANTSTDRPPSLEDLEQLVRLSVSAMEHFNAFTRQFAAVLRQLTDAREPPH
jgi:hypothetical protein